MCSLILHYAHSFLDKQSNGKPIDYLCDYSFVLEEFEVVRKSFPSLLQINFELYLTEIIHSKRILLEGQFCYPFYELEC